MKLDLKGLMEGTMNLIRARKEVELASQQRLNVCKGCSHNSDHQKKFLGYKSFRPDYHCTICGCNLELKTRCMSCECPIKKWHPLLSEEEERELEKKITEY